MSIAVLAERGVDLQQQAKFRVDKLPTTRPFGAADAYIPPDEAVARDLALHSALQDQFDRAMGRRPDSKDLLERAYNPVTDRMHIELRRQKKDISGEEAYVKEMRRNLETKLKERLLVSENVTRYDILDGELYSEHFPNTPFSTVLLRGAEYRLAHGTQEAKREGLEGERGGWELIRQKFTDPQTKVGTKMTSFSPRGIVEKSAYDRNVVDVLELKKDERGRYVESTRYLVDFDQKDYKSEAKALDSKLFAGYDGRPEDAWYLSHPVEGSIPDIKNRLVGMSAEKFDRVWESKMLQSLIDYYVTCLTAQHINWRQVALAFNAILNQVDIEEKIQQGLPIERPVYFVQNSVYDTVQTLGKELPPERGGGGCPSSKGYSNSSLGLAMSGSVGQFSLLGSGGQTKSFSGENAKNDPNLCRCGGRDAHFHCVGQKATKNGEMEPCSHAITVGKGISVCPDCGTGKVC
jgi:hypothetical protein